MAIELFPAVAAVMLMLAMACPASAFMNVGYFGAKGDGSDATAAIQSAVDSAGSNGDTVYLPAGTYTLSSSIVVSHTIGVRMVGDGIRATVIQPTAAMAGQPVIQFADSMHGSIEDLSILGVPGNPPSAGVESDSMPGGESTHLTLKDIAIGSDQPGSIVDGVRFAAQPGADYNNDEGFFENVVITNFTRAGYSILHQNSLVHTIVGGAISNGPIGVYTQGGSFKMIGTHLDNLSNVNFYFDNPADPAVPYQHPEVIANISSEGSARLLRTGTTSVMVSMTGIDAKFSSQANPVINFQANYGMLFISNSYLYYLNPSSEVDFVGGSNQVVNLTNNYIGLSKVVVKGRLLSQANCWLGKPKVRLAPNSKLIEGGELCGSLGRQRG